MTGAAAGERKDRSNVVALNARRRQRATPAELADGGLAPQEDAWPGASGNAAPEARLLGEYNLYNG